MFRERPYDVYVTKPDVIADCEDCGWQCFTRNGVGLAAQHSARYNHRTRCETNRIVTFNPKGRPYGGGER